MNFVLKNLQKMVSSLGVKIAQELEFIIQIGKKNLKEGWQ